MKRVTQWVFAALTGVCLSQTARADLTSRYLFAAKLDGAQEVPAVATTATGTASFFLNSTRDTLCVKVTTNGLSGPITLAHIHDGEAGVSGPPVVDLSTYINGGSIVATITGAQLTPTLIANLMARKHYVKVHTAANPNGEIRGQILPESDWGFMVKLDGAQEVPAVATTGKGLGFFMLGQHMDRLSFNVVFDGLTGPVTMTHLHAGPAGVSGGVVKDLMPYLSGNMISGQFDTLSSLLSMLIHDSIYINIHTAAHAGGEIRGQLMMMPYMHYDAMMDGAQEVPAVATSAVGVGVFRMNYTFDSLWYDIMVQGLTGPINLAHFHKGAMGVGGGVILGFPNTSIAGNEISGVFGAPQLSDSFIQFLNEGLIYTNVHTTAHPGGEIRGQVKKTLREGYTFNITGDQESTPVNTSAYGTGLVSVDRDESNVHYMMTVRNITPTMAHFHMGPPGVSGGIVHDIFSSITNNTAMGYWRDNITTNPFTAGSASLLTNDSLYVNFHTAGNPGGEIRGDIHSMLCSPLTLSVGDVDKDIVKATLYPNPAAHSSTLSLDAATAFDASIQLTDIAGRKLWSRESHLQKGNNNIIIPTSTLAKGMYFIRVVNEGTQQSFKLFKD